MGFDLVLFSTISQGKKQAKMIVFGGNYCEFVDSFSIAKSLELQMAKEMEMKTGKISLYSILSVSLCLQLYLNCVLCIYCCEKV